MNFKRFHQGLNSLLSSLISSVDMRCKTYKFPMSSLASKESCTNSCIQIQNSQCSSVLPQTNSQISNLSPTFNIRHKIFKFQLLSSRAVFVNSKSNPSVLRIQSLPIKYKICETQALQSGTKFVNLRAPHHHSTSNFEHTNTEFSCHGLKLRIQSSTTSLSNNYRTHNSRAFLLHTKCAKFEFQSIS